MSGTTTPLECTLSPKPHFLREAVLVSFQGDFIVDGLPRLQRLRGPVFRDLIPLLDGTRCLDELEIAIPQYNGVEIRSALCLLSRFGLLEETSGSRVEDADKGDATLAFFRRFSGVTKWNKNGMEAYRRLRESKVAIASDSFEFGEHLRDLLSQTGLMNLTLSNRNSVFEPEHGSLVVAVSRGPENESDSSWLDDYCSHRTTGWLRAVFDESRHWADIGPHFRARRPCYRCFRAMHLAKPLSSGNSEVSTDWQWWIGLLALEIICSITRIGPVHSMRGFRRYRGDPTTYADLVVPRLPGCEKCSPGSPIVSEANLNTRLPRSVVFECAIEVPGRESLDPAAEDEQKKRGEVLAQQRKRFPVSRHVRFAEANLLEQNLAPAAGGPSSQSPQTVSVSALKDLLRVTAGLRFSSSGSEVTRWCASGGNLGSPELYIIALDVGGLEPGTYFFDSEGSLVQLRWRHATFSTADLARHITTTEALPSALVVFTGAYHRLKRKYGVFGYKLAHLDAGVAMAQMQFMASALHLQSPVLPLHSEELLEGHLRLRPLQEIVTGIVALSGNSSKHAAVHLKKPCPSRMSVPTLSYDHTQFEIEPILSGLHCESKLEGRRSWVCDAKKSDAEDTDQERRSYQPFPDRGSALTILEKRKSVRQFGQRSVSAEDVKTVLYFSSDADRFEWQEQHKDAPLSFIVVANNVSSLVRGVYSFDSVGGKLVYERPISKQAYCDLLLQPELSSAALQIWILGDIAKATRVYGSWGYRQLLVRAGAAANRLWIKAIEKKLAGVIAGGFSSDVANAELGINACNRTALLIFATGSSNDTFGDK